MVIFQAKSDAGRLENRESRLMPHNLRLTVFNIKDLGLKKIVEAAIK